ncbi:hypothetical protein H072_9543 [Dactylellina haptotyla CBS 200.50]|uniref:Uncharacterized protein n=1 Tax=Dactylellina haptotyla (strain CBS 200.50) TaxID=1284197 RepID=S8A2I1_DACHA|nr:hypothetical protein H072_9543 [Dactylellina haptotyla CBS 200.50]
MTSQAAYFSYYPVPHSTFTPISHEPVSASGLTRKRKRTKSLLTNPEEEEEQEEEEDDGDHDAAQLRTAATSSGGDGLAPLPSLTTAANEAEEEEGEGDDDDDDDETSADHKRKALARNPEHRIRNAGYARDLLDALPPLQPSSLQAKHMNHVNTILHICLLRRDWKRAKRAFKLLLLSDSETDIRNLRLKRIWKIGVEVLSWDGVANDSKNTLRRAEEDEEKEEEEVEAATEKARPRRDYTKAVEYMNRLIIMYPHYKHYVVGKGVNATTILPIMMHFEVLALQDKLSTALKTGEETVVTEVISGITAVTDRLRTLQETPPWIDMVELWKLRGQLHIWAADLNLTLLNDEGAHLKCRITGHKVAQKMKERGVDGWQEFVFDYHDDNDDDRNEFTDTSF